MNLHRIERLCITIAVILIILISYGRGSAQTTASPFNGFEFGLPATIECEQFDIGGQNISYYDIDTVNSGGKYRNEGVDIYANGSEPGYYVKAQTSEKLYYSIYCSEAAIYSIKVRAKNTGTFYFTVDGSVASTQMSSGNNTWTTVEGETLGTLAVGSHRLGLEVMFSAGELMLDYITIYKILPVVSNTTPSAQDQVLANTLTNENTSMTLETALHNSTALQAALNNMNSGETLTLPSGRFLICQQHPVETLPIVVSEAVPQATLNQPIVTSVSTSGVEVRTNYTGWVGFKFKVGNQSLFVTNLGRYKLCGNNRTHKVKLFNINGSELVVSNIAAEVTVDMTLGAAGEFVYASLPVAIKLRATNEYVLMSYETVGQDTWYSWNCAITMNEVAPTAYTCCCFSENTAYPLSLQMAPQYPGVSFGPVNLQYLAVPAQTVHNYATLLSKDNVTIKGNNNGTTLVAYNRDTTIMYIGGNTFGGPTGSRAVTNIKLENIAFEGKPTRDYLGNDNTIGLIDEVQVNSANNNADLGALVVLGGKQVLQPDNTFIWTYSQNIIINSCTFKNPSNIGIELLYARDILINACNFRYCDGIEAQYRGWCGIKSMFPVENAAVLNCIFNGNVGMTSDNQAYQQATDGLIWLPTGGKWIVKDCDIQNYGLEAIQFNAGPYTVVSNTFSTWRKEMSSCALNTYHNYDALDVRSPTSIYSSYCFVNNSVNKGGGGVVGPVASDPRFTCGPYNLIASANIFGLPNFNPTNATNLFTLQYAKHATVAGNKIDSTGAGHAILYQNYNLHNPNGINCDLLALCNDFKNISHDCILIEDSVNKLHSAQFIANRMEYGYANMKHLRMVSLPPNSANKPTITLRGNQFWNCPSRRSPMVDAVALGSPRNDFNEWWGYKFTVLNYNVYFPFQVTHLGRWKTPGNTGPHNVKLVSENGVDVPGASVTVNMNLWGQPDNTFAYTELDNPIALAPGNYYLMSNEIENGDFWYAASSLQTTSPQYVTMIGPAYTVNGNYYSSTSGMGHVPVNLMNCVLDPRVGPSWNPNTLGYGENATGQYEVNNPSQFADGIFSLY